MCSQWRNMLPKEWVWDTPGSSSCECFVKFHCPSKQYLICSSYICITRPCSAPTMSSAVLPELKILLIPITPSLLPFLLVSPRKLDLLVLFPCSPPRLLLCLDSCPLLLHELLCLLDTSLLFRSVVLADLVGDDGDSAPGCYSPIG